MEKQKVLKKVVCWVLSLIFTGMFIKAEADIVNPQFIVLSVDDLWGAVGNSAYKNDTGVDFYIALSTEIAAYGLSKNPNIAPPKVVQTLAVNPGCMEAWSDGTNVNTRAKWQALFDLGYQFTSHGHIHNGYGDISNFLGDIPDWYIYNELKGSIDWLRYRLNGCHYGFAFRHGGNAGTGKKWSPVCSAFARDIDCFPHGWGSRFLSLEDTKWVPYVGVTSSSLDVRWPVELQVDNFPYWYNTGGCEDSHILSRPDGWFAGSMNAAAALASWIGTLDASYNSADNPRSALTTFMHDYDFSKAGSVSAADAELRREGLRQFFKKVLVDDNKRYYPSTGHYENVYCITYSQYQEYYWYTHGMPESNYSSVQAIIDAGNMQRVKYSVETSTTVEAESMRRITGGSAVSGGRALAAASDFIADVVNFPDDYCTYAIDITAKGVQGSDSSWPVLQVKMGARTDRLAKLSTDEDKFFSEAGAVQVNSTTWGKFTVPVNFPVSLSDRKIYALANAVVFKLKNEGNGRELDIDKVTFTRVSDILRAGYDGYTGCQDMYYEGSNRYNTQEYLKVGLGGQDTFIKFDVSSIPADRDIAGAYVEVFCYNSEGGNAMGGPSLNVAAYQTDTSWSAKPAVTGSSLDSKKIVVQGVLYEFDVTSALISAVEGGEGSLSIVLKTTDTSGGGWYLRSSRHTADTKLRPALKVMYSYSPPPVDLTPPGNIAAVRDGTSSIDISSATSTTQLSANWTASIDAESGIARYWYAIGSTPGGTDIAGWTATGTLRSVTKTGLNLTAGHTYYFSVKAENGAVTPLQSAVKTSDGVCIISGELPPVISNVQSINITANSVTISWTTDKQATSRVEYGDTVAYGNLTAEDSTPVISHSMAIAGLETGQTYHYRVISKDSNGNQAVSADYACTVTAGNTEIKTYPNPCDFSNGEVIKFVVGAAGSETGEVKIYTMSGKLVRKLIRRGGENGAIETTWDGTNEDGEKVTRGIYIYQITGASGDTVTGKLAITR